MNTPISPAAVSGLRQRFIEDMTVRGFTEKTRRYYIRIVSGFAAFLGRSPDTATAEDIRRFPVHRIHPVRAATTFRQPSMLPPRVGASSMAAIRRAGWRGAEQCWPEHAPATPVDRHHSSWR